MRHRRLEQMPSHEIGPRAVVHFAFRFRHRLIGLAFLRAGDMPDGRALLLRPCSSIHSFGMRFAIDVAFANSDGTVLRAVRGVPPGRVVRCPRAAMALEARAGELGRFLEGGRGAGSRLAFPVGG